MEHKDELTPLESRLVEFTAKGEELDCAPTGVTAPELDQINDWEDRKIRAEVLVALCTGEVPEWSVHPRRGLQLRGAYITGQVDLSLAQMSQCPLAFHTCHFEEGLDLSQATTSALRFTSCALPWLAGNEFNSSASLLLTKTHLREMSFDGAEFRGVVVLSEVHLINPKRLALHAEGMSARGVFLHDTHVEGTVYLLQANLSGQLVCDEGTTLSNPATEGATEGATPGIPDGYALLADRLSAGGVYLRDTHVEGTVSFVGANISSQLACAVDITLSNPNGYALNAERLSASSVIIGAHVEGAVSLVRANISGPLECIEGTTLSNPATEGTTLNFPDGYALAADAMSAGGVFLRDTHVEGAVSLVGANISGPLVCAGDTTLSSIPAIEGTPGIPAVKHAKPGGGGTRDPNPRGYVGDPSGYALNAPGCQVEGPLIFVLGEAAAGPVNLAYAQIGTLTDDLASWPHTYNLVGFSYYSLTVENLDRRLRWISNSKPFSPHVYTQLAEVYRRSGREGFARQVAIRRERERGRQPDLSLWVQAWNRFLGLTVAYGYQPWRALVPLVVLFVLGWFLFTLPPAQEVMVHPSSNIERPISAAACHNPYPCFSPPSTF